MAALLEDARIGLFLDDPEIRAARAQLAAEPLFRAEHFHTPDRDNCPDPFGETRYRQHFRTILRALRQGEALKIHFHTKNGRAVTYVVRPRKLQYSEKDDKFRLLGHAWSRAQAGAGNTPRNVTINLGRIVNLRVYKKDVEVEAGRTPPARAPMGTALLELSEESSEEVVEAFR